MAVHCGAPTSARTCGVASMRRGNNLVECGCALACASPLQRAEPRRMQCTFRDRPWFETMARLAVPAPRRSEADVARPSSAALKGSSTPWPCTSAVDVDAPPLTLPMLRRCAVCSRGRALVTAAAPRPCRGWRALMAAPPLSPSLSADCQVPRTPEGKSNIARQGQACENCAIDGLGERALRSCGGVAGALVATMIWNASTRNRRRLAMQEALVAVVRMTWRNGTTSGHTSKMVCQAEGGGS